ncbi:MAG: energy-coupling factor transporter transmembrane protein EcfT [Clostridia bacterium]|nr:energy-coupling factor transporter transmembrane protein EcfT [Clostridia bacterium]
MLRDVTFGQYYPTNSPIHRLDSRAKLIFAVLYITVLFMTYSFAGYAACALFVVMLAVISKIPIKTLLKSVKTVMFLVIFVSVINILFYNGNNLLWGWWKIQIYADGLIFASKMALRLILLVLGPAILTFTTTPMELTDGIESLMSPLKVLKFPVHDVAIIMSIALRMIPALMEETDKIVMAQKARGADFDSGNVFRRAKALIPVLIPLFVGAFRRADELALALDARCYNATPNRTRYKILRFKWADFIATLVFLAFATVLLLDKYLIGMDNLIWGLFQ